MLNLFMNCFLYLNKKSQQLWNLNKQTVMLINANACGAVY